MSNFFDQFDAGSDGNFFDQFDAAQPAGSPSNPRRYTNPNRGKSSAELAGRGALKFANDVSLARRQIMAGLAGMVGLEGAEDEQRTLEGIADVRKLDPVMQTGAGQAGYTAAAMVPAVGAAFVPGANTAVGAGLIGGGMGLFQPVGTDDSRAANVAIGAGTGALAQGAFNLVGRVAQPVKSALNRAESRAVQFLRDKGVELSVGQQTGSRAAQAVERALGDSPASQGTMLRQGEKFRDSFTRAVLKTVGENADGATPDVLGRAATRIGTVMDDVYGKYSLDIADPAVLGKISSISDEAARILPNDGKQVVVQVERILDKAAANGGKLDGKTAAAIRGELGKLSKQRDVSPYAVELLETLDDALAKAAKGTDDVARLAEARSQYRNLMAISDVADTTANGRVPAAALASRLKSSTYTKGSMRLGRGDVELARLARAGSTVVDRFPQSGTAPRAAAQLVLPAALGGAGYAASGDLETAAKIAGATWAIPKAGAWVMTNPAVRNYLAEGIGQPVVRNALLAPSRAGLGTTVPAYLLAQE